MSEMLLILRQGQLSFGLPAEKVRTIQPSGGLIHLPLQPEWMQGLLNYKGQAVPVAHLGALAGEQAGERERVTVVCETEKGLLALCADEALEMLVPEGPLLALAGGSTEHLLRLAGEASGETPVMVIDLEETAQALLGD